MKIRKIKIKKMNKKADVSFGLSEVAKLVIAVICIALLVLLATKMYSLFFKKTAIEQARENLDALYKEIGEVQNGKNESEAFIEAPVDWQIIAWPNRLLNSLPDECKINCICICPIPSVIPDYNLNTAIERALTQCNSIGVCKEVSQKIITFDRYDVNNPLEIKKPNAYGISLISGEINIKEKK